MWTTIILQKHFVLCIHAICVPTWGTFQSVRCFFIRLRAGFFPASCMDLLQSYSTLLYFSWIPLFIFMNFFFVCWFIQTLHILDMGQVTLSFVVLLFWIICIALGAHICCSLLCGLLNPVFFHSDSVLFSLQHKIAM